MKIPLMITGFVLFGGWALLLSGIMLTNGFGMILLLSPPIFLSYFGSIAIAIFLYRKMGTSQKVE